MELQEGRAGVRQLQSSVHLHWQPTHSRPNHERETWQVREGLKPKVPYCVGLADLLPPPPTSAGTQTARLPVWLSQTFQQSPTHHPSSILRRAEQCVGSVMRAQAQNPTALEIRVPQQGGQGTGSLGTGTKAFPKGLRLTARLGSNPDRSNSNSSLEAQPQSRGQGICAMPRWPHQGIDRAAV